jgi:hypothetical protein
MEHSPAPLEAVQLIQRLKIVLLKPTQKRKQAGLHSFFSKGIGASACGGSQGQWW